MTTPAPARPETAPETAPKTAMILAAGLGTRMRPLTDTRPKPLIEAGGKALIDWTLDRFASGGVKRCVVNLHHLGDHVRAHLQSRAAPAHASAPGPEIAFSPEPELLETGGGVKNALKLLGPAPFFTANGDSIWLDGPTPALARMAAAWDDGRMDVLLLLNSTVEAVGYEGPGDFLCESGGLLARRPEGEVSPYAFTGVQMIHPRAFEKAPEGAFSMNLIYDAAIKAGRLFGVVHDGLWLHVGTPEGLAQAEAVLAERYPDPRRRGRR
ncbi:MAG: nucleotidyltransferase family protein [Rhodospirillales bacterium]